LTSVRARASTAVAPPLGVKATLTVTFTLPVRSSFFSSLPLAAIGITTVPAAPTKLTVDAPARWPAARPTVDFSRPGPGTLTARLAVPFFLFNRALPKLNRFDAGGAAGGCVGATGACGAGAGA
jgi:hypothetical protein